jgi:predicted DNA-binding transcriptional regulator YafY
MGRPNEHERIERLFSVLHLLKSAHFYSFEALGRLMGSSEKEARTVIDLLSTIDMEGYHPPFFAVGPLERERLEADNDAEVDIEEKPSGIWVWDEFHPFERPFDFSRAEALALLAALDYLGARADAALRRKLSAFLFGATDTEPQTRILIDTVMHERYMSRLSYLVEHAQPAQLLYQSQGAAQSRRYQIEPLRVYANRIGDWYVDAFSTAEDEEEGFLRTFRLDRIVEMEEQDGRFVARPVPSESFFSQLEKAPVALIEMPVGEPLEQRDWPGLKVVEEGADTKTVSVPFLDTDWLARRIIGKAGRAHVIAPPEIVQAVCATAAQMLDEATRARPATRS